MNFIVVALLNMFFRKNTDKSDDKEIGTFPIHKTLPVHSMDAELKSVRMSNIRLTTNSEDILVLLLDEDIKPIFKKGSILVVDRSLAPEDDVLVAAKIEGHKNILIRKFLVKGNENFLYSYDRNIKIINITNMEKCEIIGVVVQANIKLNTEVFFISIIIIFKKFCFDVLTRITNNIVNFSKKMF